MKKSTSYPDHYVARLPPGTLARLRCVQGERESVADVVRAAVERELVRRELDQDNATRVLAELRAPHRGI